MKPRLLRNGRFTSPIAIDDVKYTVGTSITKAINKSFERDGLLVRCDGFTVEDNGDVRPLDGYVHIAIEPFSNCFPVVEE